MTGAILLQVLLIVIGAVLGGALGTRDERALFDARARSRQPRRGE
jgi:hypothetical protein